MIECSDVPTDFRGPELGSHYAGRRESLGIFFSVVFPEMVRPYCNAMIVIMIVAHIFPHDYDDVTP